MNPRACRISEAESGDVFDENMRYIGTGPNGLPELLKLVTEITKELQTDGVIEAKFGRKLPVILADFDCTWYMINATAEANPNGEAEAYIQACPASRRYQRGSARAQ